VGQVLRGSDQLKHEIRNEFVARRGIRIRSQQNIQCQRLLSQRWWEIQAALGAKPVWSKRRRAYKFLAQRRPQQNILVFQLGRLPATDRPAVHGYSSRRERKKWRFLRNMQVRFHRRYL